MKTSSEIIQYLMQQGQGYMTHPEVFAIRRLDIVPETRKVYRNPEWPGYTKSVRIFGWEDEEANRLAEMPPEDLKMHIAKRILRDHGEGILPRCPHCQGLLRTPRARQCRHCGSDWH